MSSFGFVILNIRARLTADHKAVNVYVNQRANISLTKLGAISLGYFYL